VNDTIGYAIVALFIMGSTYGLIKQLQLTMNIQRNNKSDRRLVIGNYLTSISFAGFIISFILNVLVAIQVIQSSTITSNNTSVSCVFFLLVLLVSRFLITPKNH
jgi:phosphotransferase system  glucose/maltose/N-acetylglucosamine-specific IIC component